MKSLLLFLLTFLSAKSAYVLQRVDNTSGAIWLIEFDSTGAAYFFSTNDTNKLLTKLTPTNEILWSLDTTDDIRGILITSQDDVYLHLQSPETLSTSVGILKEDGLTIEEITKGVEPFVLDEEDNLYFNGDGGVFVLRPNSTTPIFIKNLENKLSFYGNQGAAIDSAGNVYFGLMDVYSSLMSIGIVTKEAKHDEALFATLINLSPDSYIEYLTPDEENNTWVFTFNSTNSQIRKITNGSVADIISDESYVVRLAMAVKDRILVLPTYIESTSSSAFFLSLEGEVTVIPDLADAAGDLFAFTTVVADKEGYIYFGFKIPNEEGQILVIKPDEVEANKIDFPDESFVKFITLDENDDLWVINDGQRVYYLKKGSITPEEVPGIELRYTGVSLNKVTNQVFVLSMDGLYFIKNDSD